jgi:hypothetical protein
MHQLTAKIAAVSSIDAHSWHSTDKLAGHRRTVRYSTSVTRQAPTYGDAIPFVDATSQASVHQHADERQ